MAQTIRLLALASALAAGSAFPPAQAAEREQVRMVINLVAGVKKPFPENLRNHLGGPNGCNSTPTAQPLLAFVSTTKFVGVTST